MGEEGGSEGSSAPGEAGWAPVDPGQAQRVVGTVRGLCLVCNSCYPLLCAEQALD